MFDGLRDHDLCEDRPMFNPLVWLAALCLWIIIGSLLYFTWFGAS